MHKEKIFLLLFWSVAVFLLGMNIWGNWAEKTYEKWKDSPFIWAEFNRFRSVFLKSQELAKITFDM
jgi:hypothetical protein